MKSLSLSLALATSLSTWASPVKIPDCFHQEKEGMDLIPGLYALWVKAGTPEAVYTKILKDFSNATFLKLKRAPLEYPELGLTLLSIKAELPKGKEWTAAFEAGASRELEAIVAQAEEEQIEVVCYFIRQGVGF